MSSTGKVALVTGSTSGIGRECVKRFAKRGISVIVTGSRDESLVKDLLAELQGSVTAYDISILLYTLYKSFEFLFANYKILIVCACFDNKYPGIFLIYWGISANSDMGSIGNGSDRFSVQVCGKFKDFWAEHVLSKHKAMKIEDPFLPEQDTSPNFGRFCKKSTAWFEGQLFGGDSHCREK
jgi:short chain dehydrogenase